MSVADRSVPIDGAGTGQADRERLQWLLDLQPDPALLADDDGRIAMANQAIGDLFGYSIDELVGGPLEVLIPPERHADHRHHREGYVRQRSTRPMGSGTVFFGRHRDGRDIAVEVSLAPVPSELGMLTLAAVRDVTARRTTDLTVLRLAALVGSSNEAIISMATDGTIISWNPAAVRMFGYTEEEVLGRAASMLLPPGYNRQQLDATMTQVLAGEQVASYDTLRRHKDGTLVEVSVCLSALRDDRDRLIGTSKVISEIGRRKQAERDLARALATAEATSNELRSFSYSVAHDLRTPLRAINGFGQLLLEDCGPQLDQDGTAYIERICAAAVRMGELIDSLLGLARLHSIETISQEVDLSRLVDDWVDRVVADAPERGSSTEVVVQPGVIGTGDPSLLAVVLDNLLSNAWKFTRDQDAARIEFGQDASGYFVRDNGAGFDMAYAEKLFGIFQRLHTQEEFEGTGIGLATVQRIITRHGGRVWANGAPDQGATFRFTLTGDQE